MNISEGKTEVIGKTNFGVDSSGSNAAFSGWDVASVDTHSDPTSECRNFLLSKVDYFRQSNLKNNRVLIGLFPSCARLNLGRQFVSLAKGNNRGADNANAIIELIMDCSSHQMFAPTLSKIFPEFPTAIVGDAVEKRDGLPAGASGQDDALGFEDKCQELPTDVSKSGANRVDSPDESILSAVPPLHAKFSDKPDSNWSTDKQERFFEMLESLVVQRMSIDDTSAFRGQRSYKRDAGNIASSCSPFAAHGLISTGFYQIDERSYEEKQLSKALQQNRISHKSIKDELDCLYTSLSKAAEAGLFPENCDLYIQVYKDGQKGHTRDFSVWQEGDQVAMGNQAPCHVDAQRQKAVLKLTAESLAMLNARLVYDADIVFEQRWMSLLGDSGLVDCIKKLIAQQKNSRNKARQNNASQSGAAQTDASQSSASQDNAAQTDASQSSASQDNAAQTDASQSSASQNNAAQTDASQSSASQNNADQSDASQSSASQNNADQSDASQSSASQNNADQSDASQEN